MSLILISNKYVKNVLLLVNWSDEGSQMTDGMYNYKYLNTFSASEMCLNPVAYSQLNEYLCKKYDYFIWDYSIINKNLLKSYQQRVNILDGITGKLRTGVN